MEPRVVAAAVVESLTPSRWQAVTFGVVFALPWAIGLFRLGELIGHLAVVLAVLARKHWGW